MTRKLSITEARGKLMELAEAFSGKEQVEAVEVTRRGESVLAILPWQDYENLRETVEIVTDEKMMASIRRGLEDASQKRVAQLKDVRKELGI